MSTLRLLSAATACFALLTLSSCAGGPKSEEADGGGSLTRIAGGWVSDTFTGKRNALLVRPDGKAEYTYSEGKKRLADEEVDVDDAVFDSEHGGTVVWAVDLAYKGRNTWAAVNPVQLSGPQPVPYPYDPEAEWRFDSEWRLEGGCLYAVKSKNRYMSLSQLSALSGSAAPAPAPAAPQ